MKLAVLSAGVNPLRQALEQTRIETPAGELPRQRSGVKADDPSLESSFDHRMRERSGRSTPEREDWLDPRSCELAFSVGADVLKEDVAENDPVHSH